MDKNSFFLWATKPVPYTFGDQTIYLRQWSALEREEFSKWCKGKEDQEASAEVLARVIVNSVCDETGKALLTLEDIAKVKGMPAKILDDLSKACVSLNMVDKASLDDAAKN